MSNSFSYRMLFLGDRRISWEALKMLGEPGFSGTFDIRGLVTSPELHERYLALGWSAPRFINNAARNTQAITTCIAEERIDLILSVQYNWILPPAVLESVGRRAFNLHNAKLPDYKGYNSIAHAILNGDTVHESTVHWMADEVDSGDIAYVGRTSILPVDTARSLYIRSVDGAVGALRNLLNDLKDRGDAPRIPIAAGTGIFYQRQSVTEIADLTEVKNADRVTLIARAAFFPPFTVAYRLHNGERAYVIPASDEGCDPAAMTPANAPLYDA